MTQGIADISNYNNGLRGVRVRAKNCTTRQKYFSDYPFSTNTTTLIDSILKANEKGKIKSKKNRRQYAADVEI
jgi:topoisomerase-4 subunit A